MSFLFIKEAAIKVESAASTKQVLKMEVAVLKRIQGKQHFCDLLGYGRTEKVNYLVMNMLGPNLSELRKRQPHQVFTISTTLRLGVQILDALQTLHNCGFLHRDLKPSNIAIGLTPESSRTCFMLDFGLARQYITPTGEVREPRPTAGFRGTVRYASINAHLARDLGRNDDLWSLFYMLIELCTGELPWRKVKEKDEVGKLKAECDHAKLIKGLPSEFNLFLKYIRTLTYFDKPEYCYLIILLKKAMQKLGIHESDPFDWEQDISAPSVTTASVGSPPAFRSHGKGSPEVVIVNKGGTKTDCSDVRELSKQVANASEKNENVANNNEKGPANGSEPSPKQDILPCPALIMETKVQGTKEDTSEKLYPPKCVLTIEAYHTNTENHQNVMHPHAAPLPSAKETIPTQSSLHTNICMVIPRPPQVSPPNDYICISARRKRFVRIKT